MKSLLLVFASELEAKTVFPDLDFKENKEFYPVHPSIAVAVLGVGILPFSLSLVKLFNTRLWHSVIQLGIAGAFVPSALKIGEAVIVEKDVLGDQGYQKARAQFFSWAPPAYLSSPIQNLPPSLQSLKRVSAITVNTCTGTQALAQERYQIFHADIESMEGAPLFAFAKDYGVEAFQIRAISNFVGPRNKKEWDIASALERLKQIYRDIEAFYENATTGNLHLPQ